MIELLIIADDFTGALDTGVQYAQLGIETHVTADVSCNFQTAAPSVRVLVVDAETRHLSSEEAGRIVGEITKRAVDYGIPAVYKKTDSALRGNIGSELSAQLTASNCHVLFFVPAYPETGRITKGGVHYVNGIPVAQSVFGKDPFEPVRCSVVSELIAGQSGVRVVNASADKPPVIEADCEKTIYVFDAQSSGDLSRIADIAKAHNVRMLAGCAGFARLLPSLLNMPVSPRQVSVRADGIVAISGSLNPVTLAQIRMADKSGFPRFTLTTRQKMDPEYVCSRESDDFIAEVAGAYQTCKRVIIESVDSSAATGKSDEFTQPEGYTREEARRLIADNIGSIVQRMIEHGIRGVYVIIGGDTFMSVVKRIGCTGIVPLREMTAGVVLSCIEYREEKLYVISKSGGFGDEDVLLQLEQMLCLEKLGAEDGR